MSCHCLFYHLPVSCACLSMCFLYHINAQNFTLSPIQFSPKFFPFCGFSCFDFCLLSRARARVKNLEIGVQVKDHNSTPSLPLILQLLLLASSMVSWVTKRDIPRLKCEKSNRTLTTPTILSWVSDEGERRLSWRREPACGNQH